MIGSALTRSTRRDQDSAGQSESLPRGPNELALRQAIAFGIDPYGFFERCVRDFGHTFTIRFPSLPPAVTTSDPALCRELLALRPEERGAAS